MSMSYRSSGREERSIVPSISHSFCPAIENKKQSKDKGNSALCPGVMVLIADSNRKLMKTLACVCCIMLHHLMKSSSGCLAFGLGRPATRTILWRTVSLSTRLAQSTDAISTFGPDEPNILAAESDKNDAYTLKLSVPTPEDMEDVGAILSMGTTAGDTILLGGDLGAGKTCFSRGFVRARTGNDELRVTSPTYLLCNTYPSQDGMLIHHMDLYRLSGKEEDLQPLDMDHVLKECISLIEWPSRLGNMTPSKRLDITFRISHDDSEDNDSEEIERTLTLRAHGNQWEDRLKFLEEEGYVDDLLCE